MAVVALALAVTATALAGAPRAGTYRGTLAPPRTAFTISMKLKGAKLTRIRISNVPFYCSSGGPAIPVGFPSTTISNSGRFRVRAVNRIKVGPLKGRIGEKLTLTGRFSHTTVKGRLTTVVPNAKVCNGSSAYTAKR